MTTTFARRSTQSSVAAKKPKPLRETPLAEQVPVLIRLPDLGEVTAKAENLIRRPEAETPAADHPTRLGVMQPVETPEPSSDSADASDSEVQTLPFQRPTQESASETRPSPWANLQIPRAAVHAIIALSLIGVFVFAYLAIVGAGGNTEPQSVEQPTATNSVAANQQKALEGTTDTLPPLPAQSPALPAQTPALSAQAVDGASTPQDPAPRAGSAPPVESHPAPPAVEPPGTPDVSAKDAPAPAVPPVPETTAEPPQPAIDAPVSSANPLGSDQPHVTPAQAAGQPAEPPSTPDIALPPADPLAGNPADTPLIPDRWPREPNVDAPMPSYEYPVTNPATFQYPPDYHLRLERIAHGPQATWEPSAPGGAYEPGRVPSTARLQPPIEPPPMR